MVEGTKPIDYYTDDKGIVHPIFAASTFWNRTGTVLSPKTAGDDVSLEFGDLVSEQNPDGYDAIRLKATASDVDVVLGNGGYFNIYKVADAIQTDNVFNVRNNGDIFITGSVDMNSHQINELTNPTLDQDAATKKYVDDKHAGMVLHYVGGAGEPAFQNSWANVGDPYQVFCFGKDTNGGVHLFGRATGGGANTVMFTLPVGNRPPKTLLFITKMQAAGYIQISANGEVKLAT